MNLKPQFDKVRDFIADVVTLPIRTPSHLFQRYQSGSMTGKPESRAVSAMHVVAGEAFKSLPGAVGFLAGPEVGFSFMAASNVFYNTALAGMSFDVQTPVLPRTAERQAQLQIGLDK